MLFIFDQSSAHRSFAADALNAKKMNVNPGGKQPKMHATRIPMNNPNPRLQGTYQSMVFPDNHSNNPGEAKGMEAVLRERGLWPRLVAACASGKSPVGRCTSCKASVAKQTKIEADARARMEAEPETYGSIGEANSPNAHLTDTDLGLAGVHDTEDALLPGESLDTEVDSSGEGVYCCMEKCLAAQEDFRSEKPLLQLEIEAAGHLCLFLPKFHCELNPIEMYWGFAKHSKSF